MNLLVLFPRKLWRTKMSIVRRDVIREMLRRGAKLSGQGWPDYDESATLQSNVDRLGGDAVFAYKPLGSKDFPALKECRSLRQPLILSYNEMWDVQWTTQEIVESGCDIAVCHHENDIPRFPHVDCRFVHIPHCANPELFAKHAKPWEERDIDFLLTGVLSPQIYPLRERFANLIRSKKLLGVIHRHPGYRLPDVEACDRQAEEYAKMLGRAKVALCCTSRYKYALCKIPEGAMSGANVVSDLPQQESFRPLIHAVDADWPDERLVVEIRRAAEQPREVKLEQFTTAHYVTTFSALL